MATLAATIPCRNERLDTPEFWFRSPGIVELELPGHFKLLRHPILAVPQQ